MYLSKNKPSNHILKPVTNGINFLNLMASKPINIAGLEPVLRQKGYKFINSIVFFFTDIKI